MKRKSIAFTIGCILTMLWTYSKAQSNISFQCKELNLSESQSLKCDQWDNIAVLLFGKWLLKPDSYKNYNAFFTLNKQDDERAPKKVTSDKVQTIAIHVMVNRVNIDKLIQQLDMSKLNSAIDKN